MDAGKQKQVKIEDDYPVELGMDEGVVTEVDDVTPEPENEVYAYRDGRVLTVFPNGTGVLEYNEIDHVTSLPRAPRRISKLELPGYLRQVKLDNAGHTFEDEGQVGGKTTRKSVKPTVVD